MRRWKKPRKTVHPVLPHPALVEFTARLEVRYADRAADTYEWAQSYYALLDTGLINATPDTSAISTTRS